MRGMADDGLNQFLDIRAGKLQIRILKLSADQVLTIGKMGDQTAERCRHTEHLFEIVGFQWTLVGTKHRLLHGEIVEFPEIILQPLEMFDKHIDFRGGK